MPKINFKITVPSLRFFSYKFFLDFALFFHYFSFRINTRICTDVHTHVHLALLLHKREQMHKTQFCALLFSINIFQRVIVLCQITHPFFYCCIPLYFADVPKLNSTSLPLIDIWVVLNLFLLPINATSKLMYISYFCRLHLGMDYLKTGWLGLKVNAYVILLDIARFPSVVAIPFVFH